MTCQPTTHTLPLSAETSWVGYFDNSRPAALWIRSGDLVRTSTKAVGGGQLRPDMSTAEALATRQFYKDQGLTSHTLTGPIGVEDAEPGDSIAVTIRRLEPDDVCYTYNLPRGGCLAEDDIAPLLTVGRINHAEHTIDLFPGVRLPLKPMLGILAVAPPMDGRVDAGPPDVFGGNIDWPELGEGSTLYLPVFKPGALVCLGDAHAAQGCGEVGGNSMEVAMRLVEIEIRLLKGERREQPFGETATHWVTFGFHPDLDEAARFALRDAMEFLCRHQKLSREAAYHICSGAVDLHITQNVSRNKGVHAAIPKALFRS